MRGLEWNQVRGVMEQVFVCAFLLLGALLLANGLMDKIHGAAPSQHGHDFGIALT